MKLTIEMQIGNSAVETYAEAIKIIRTQLGRVHGPNSHLAKPEYGDGGPLIDAKNDTVGSWKMDLSGDQRLTTRGRRGAPSTTSNTIQ